MNYTTKNRMVILDFIKRNEDKSVTVTDIMSHLRESDIKTNITTVYRYLDKLTKDRTVIKHTENSVSVYQYAKNESCSHHLHIQCTVCKKSVHIDCDFMENIERHIFSHHGFSLNCNKSMLYGLCEVCREKTE